MQNLTEIIRFRVSPQVYKKAQTAASTAKRTISDYVRILLESALSGHKDGKK